MQNTSERKFGGIHKHSNCKKERFYFALDPLFDCPALADA
jgi:hypothetical protein